jgi:hypothetical protein
MPDERSANFPTHTRNKIDTVGKCHVNKRQLAPKLVHRRPVQNHASLAVITRRLPVVVFLCSFFGAKLGEEGAQRQK